MSAAGAVGGPYRGGCVAIARAADAPSHDPGWVGVLIRGPSGAGKSTFALRLVALGAKLVADDYVELEGRNDLLWARAPARLSGLIEARGVGLLRLSPLPAAPIAWIVELTEQNAPAGPRLPNQHFDHFFGFTIPVLSLKESSRTAAIVYALVRHGAVLDRDAP